MSQEEKEITVKKNNSVQTFRTPKTLERSSKSLLTHKKIREEKIQTEE